MEWLSEYLLHALYHETNKANKWKTMFEKNKRKTMLEKNKRYTKKEISKCERWYRREIRIRMNENKKLRQEISEESQRTEEARYQVASLNELLRNEKERSEMLSRKVENLKLQLAWNQAHNAHLSSGSTSPSQATKNSNEN